MIMITWLYTCDTFVTNQIKDPIMLMSWTLNMADHIRTFISWLFITFMWYSTVLSMCLTHVTMADTHMSWTCHSAHDSCRCNSLIVSYQWSVLLVFFFQSQHILKYTSTMSTIRTWSGWHCCWTLDTRKCSVEIQRATGLWVGYVGHRCIQATIWMLD